MGLAPKYDQLGFDGFPERHHRNPDELIASHSIPQCRAEWIESFIQEWLWFGLMDEFAKACSISINLDDFIIDSPSGSGKIITTASLYDIYACRVAIRELDVDALAIGLEMGDLVRLPYNPSEEAVHQIINFWRRKMEQGLPSGDILMARAAEQLNKPHGKDAIYQDENGIAVPLNTLQQRILGCRALNAILSKGQQPERQQPERQLNAKRLKFAESIARAQSALRIFMGQYDPVVRFDIIVSIDILCHTLAKIIDVILNETIKLSSPNFKKQFEEIMFAHNWCPSRIAGLVNSVNTPLAYVASLLPSYDTRSHDGCRPTKCLKGPSTVQAMVGVHRENCDQKCVTTTVREIQLIHMWNEGGIPGVRLANSMQPEFVDIVDCTRVPFIAISHVWSHGLGNPTMNELPSCQLRFLCDLVKRLGGEDAILWIDALSIPIDPEAKRIAISKLRRVYSEASKVLVIDKDLMQVGSDQTEQILQLFGSEWQRRLWTLQESRLARELFIHFKDSSVPVSELIARRPVSQFSDSNADIFDFYLVLKEDMRRRFSSNQDAQSQFMALVENLAPRSVTVKSDEPICLATLLGLSLEDYDPYPTILDIYRSLPNIPQDLMFLKQPRLQVPGLTWAPATFLEMKFVSFWGGNKTPPPGRLLEEGLIVTKDCLLLDKDLDFRRVPSNPSEIYIITTSHEQNFAIQADNLLSPEGRPLRVEPSRMIKSPAVIWEKPCSFFALDGSFRKTSKAVLVSRVLDREGVMYCRFEMGLDGWYIRDEHEDFHQRMVRTSGEIIGRISAELMHEKHFCVS